MGFWKGKGVVVTGGSGFLGSHVVEILEAEGAKAFVPHKRDFNLMKLEDGLKCFLEAKPEMVIHGAAFYGGIWINQVYPGRIFYENLVMGANVIEACRLAGVKKFIGIGTACSYPGYLEGNLSEDKLWDGPLHETVRNYGLTKKMMQVQCWAYGKQYGFKGIHLILTNLYGPRDSYNEQRSHVVAALIRKFVEATMENKLEVEVWGTGKPIREFLYVEDCAQAIVRAAEVYDDAEPLNIGTGMGTSIRELTELVQKISGFRGKLRWNADKPDGQMVKILDVSKMKRILGWVPPTDLRTGLQKTIKWYREHKPEADARF